MRGLVVLAREVAAELERKWTRNVGGAARMRALRGILEDLNAGI